MHHTTDLTIRTGRTWPRSTTTPRSWRSTDGLQTELWRRGCRCRVLGEVVQILRPDHLTRWRGCRLRGSRRYHVEGGAGTGHAPRAELGRRAGWSDRRTV
jgi:hypothetical protein